MGKLTIHIHRSFQVRVTISVTDAEGIPLGSLTSEWRHEPSRDRSKITRLEFPLSILHGRQALSRWFAALRSVAMPRNSTH